MSNADPMTAAMDRFFSEFTSKEFTQSYLRKKHRKLRFPGLNEAVFAGINIEKLLSTVPLMSRMVSMHRDGKEFNATMTPLSPEMKRMTDHVLVSPAKVRDHIKQGFSFKFSDFHALNQLDDSFLRTVRQHFKCKVSCNLYFTPPNGQCFSQHVDEYDLFIVQCEGEKVWQIIGHDGATQEITLEKNDVLYLPAGLAHVCRTRGLASLHATLGLHPYSIGDVMQDVMGILHEQHLLTPTFKYEDQHGLTPNEANRVLSTVLAGLKVVLRELSHEN